jgi:hypothetical protein
LSLWTNLPFSHPTSPSATSESIERQRFDLAPLAQHGNAGRLQGARTMPNDDTHLLTLGTRLDKIADEWLAKMAADNTLNAAHDAKVEAFTGIPASDAPPYDETHPYWAIRKATRLNHPDPELEEWTDFHKRLFPLVEKILAQRAHSLAELRVQATAVSLAAAELWDVGRPDEDEPHHEKMFVEAVCSFLNVVPVPLRNL